MQKPPQLSTKADLREWLIDRLGAHALSRISLHYSTSEPTGPSIQIDMTKKMGDYDYAIKTVPTWQSLIIWDLNYRRSVKSTAEYLVVQTQQIHDGIPGPDNYFAIYHGLMGIACIDAYEKVAVVGYGIADLFFKNLAANIKLNPYDEGFLPEKERKSLSESPKHDDAIDRELRRTSTTQLVREHTFRPRVLAAYGNQCAICRLAITESLQAAHKRGREARKAPYYRTKDGVCLCANHHYMYDNGLIDLDFASETAIARNAKVDDDPGWREFLKRYGGKLVTPVS